MKTKFALLFLPALMALSSCGAAKPLVEQTFLEDTTAHSELFGKEDRIGGRLTIKKRNAGEEISKPKIGYQIKYDSVNDKLAIRFVAAIKEFNVKAYWRRGVAAPDGTVPNSKDFSDAGQEAEKYYLSLSDGVNVINAGEDEYGDFSGFVVYTIHNIPYTANKDSYVAAYVNLVGSEENEDVHNNSLALAVKIEKKTNYESNNVFAFDPTMNKHFLQGTINGVLYDGGTNGLYEESSGTPSSDFAWYENVPLLKTDSFGSFYYDHDRVFQYFGNNSFSDGTDYFKESSLSGYNTPKNAGTYSLHISNDGSHPNHLYANASAIESGTKFSIRLRKGCKWDIAGDWFAIYMFNDSTSTNTWVKMDNSNPSYYEITNYDPNLYPGFIVCRMKSFDTDSLSWDNKDNQSRNLYLSNLPGLVSYFELAEGDPWDNNPNDYFSIQ